MLGRNRSAKPIVISALSILMSTFLLAGCSQVAITPTHLSPDSVNAESDAEAHAEPAQGLSDGVESFRTGLDLAESLIDWEAQAAGFVDLLANGDLDTAVEFFDEMMLNALPSATLQGVWATRIAQVGPCQSQLGTQVASQAPYEIVYVVT